MFKVIAWYGNQRVERDTFNTIEEAKAFIDDIDGAYLAFLSYGEEGYDIVDGEGNLIERYM